MAANFEGFSRYLFYGYECRYFIDKCRYWTVVWFEIISLEDFNKPRVTESKKTCVWTLNALEDLFSCILFWEFVYLLNHIQFHYKQIIDPLVAFREKYIFSDSNLYMFRCNKKNGWWGMEYKFFSISNPKFLKLMLQM